MADEIRCVGCNGVIENPASPEVMTATKSVKPPTLKGKLEMVGDDTAYFHVRCFHGQLGYQADQR